MKSCLQLLELVRVNHKRVLFGSGARSVFEIKVLSSRNDRYLLWGGRYCEGENCGGGAGSLEDKYQCLYLFVC